MRGVEVWRWVAREERRAVLLDEIEWTVEPGEHWVVLGPNGAGKTTLLNLAAAVSHPSAGEVEVLGEQLGAVDMRALRERIGTVEARLGRRDPRRPRPGSTSSSPAPTARSRSSTNGSSRPTASGPSGCCSKSARRRSTTAATRSARRASASG